ncbi:glycosyl hydrolase [Microcella daejeonensis]|uniref:Glycosyl hydrolase n=1 Tax=Microcella daejeonensis TaxID=2994971 RepID=A0A9E8MP96_9MICO|nr:glycosyl hydrolase [Microcella daejeonensis]WAB82351.1 glycosyl hydrolase [Microcella daejeonensis]
MSRRPIFRTRALAVLAVGALLTALGACSTSEGSGRAIAEERCPADAASLVPTDGALFGVNLDWGTETLAELSGALGRTPAVAVVFSELPLTAENRTNLVLAAEQARGENSSLLLTLEPRAGLAAVTPAVAEDLAVLLHEISATGVPVTVRYAHEMNGSWYAWGQQPIAYVASFRLLAAALDEGAPGTTMMWAPNYGGGYPFAGGEFETTRTDLPFRILDTDDDGILSMADDPYAPYYPGDDVVDWVGMSLYHWGSVHPWGENEIAEPTKFAQQLIGEYDGLGGDDRALPDFYGQYAERAGKPLAIPETAAFVTADAPADLALDIKRSWWTQVLSAETAARFPALAMINWFEWNKFEVEVGGDVDWTIARDDATLSAFTRELPTWLRFAPEADPCAAPAS